MLCRFIDLENTKLLFYPGAVQLSGLSRQAEGQGRMAWQPSSVPLWPSGISYPSCVSAFSVWDMWIIIDSPLIGEVRIIKLILGST